MLGCFPRKQKIKNSSDKIRDRIILVASNSTEDTLSASIPSIQYPAHRYCERYFALTAVATAKVTLLTVSQNEITETQENK